MSQASPLARRRQGIRHAPLTRTDFSVARDGRPLDTLAGAAGLPADADPDRGMSREGFARLGEALRATLDARQEAIVERFVQAKVPTLHVGGFAPADASLAALALMAACGLDPMTYDDSPVPAMVTSLGNESAGGPLRPHLGFRTEGPYFGINAMAQGHAAAPSAVAYAAVEADASQAISLLPLADLLGDLDDDTQAALHAPDFRYVRAGRRQARHIPVLGTGAEGTCHVRFDWQAFDTEPDAPKSAHEALEAFRLAIIAAAHRGVCLGPGEVLLLNNRLALHATDRLIGGPGRYVRLLGRDADWQGRLACRWPVVAIT